MGNENVLFVHNGIIFRWKAKFTHEIGMYIDGHKKDYIEWDIPNSERQIVHVLSHQHLFQILRSEYTMWNITKASKV